MVDLDRDLDIYLELSDEIVGRERQHRDKSCVHAGSIIGLNDASKLIKMFKGTFDKNYDNIKNKTKAQIKEEFDALIVNMLAKVKNLEEDRKTKAIQEKSKEEAYKSITDYIEKKCDQIVSIKNNPNIGVRPELKNKVKDRKKGNTPDGSDKS